MMWIIFASISALFIALLVLHHYKSATEHVEHLARTSTAEALPSPALSPALLKDDLRNIRENLTEGVATSPATEQQELNPQQVDLEEDPRLRIFEEL
jgi:hypothetical protein